MNITLIGGSGFVGTRLLGLLGEQPEKYTLRNIDKRQSHFFPHVTQLADVRDAEALREKIAGSDVVVLLAAEHRDDVSPVSLYYDVNVGGMKNVLEAMLATGVRRLVFTSSVAVYGLNKENPDETHPADPFNHYGKSKWQAEEVLQQWHAEHPDFNIGILRPTVIFGERNRGNVFNLLRQISSGRFLMIGGGRNRKSMAYVGNIVSFIRFLIDEKTEGYNVYNYVDKPDFTMNELVFHVSEVLGKHIPTTHVPYWLGMLRSAGRHNPQETDDKFRTGEKILCHHPVRRPQGPRLGIQRPLHARSGPRTHAAFRIHRTAQGRHHLQIGVNAPVMQITQAQFRCSSAKVSQVPDDTLPDFAFIGRSNVGKSSLINMLTAHGGLAKVSGTPGKTQLINHFRINDRWYLVDLPGYGYARTSKAVRGGFEKLITDYVLRCERLHFLFVLVDARLEPQAIDLRFIRMLGENGVPFGIVFTKTDKLSKAQTERSLARYRATLSEEWEELPPMFVTSSARGTGRDAILDFIGRCLTEC